MYSVDFKDNQTVKPLESFRYMLLLIRILTPSVIISVVREGATYHLSCFTFTVTLIE
jgi:hypothetical protein